MDTEVAGIVLPSGVGIVIPVSQIGPDEKGRPATGQVDNIHLGFLAEPVQEGGSYGTTYGVLVSDDGFIMDGRRFTSLRHVAEAITGAHWSGDRHKTVTSPDCIGFRRLHPGRARYEKKRAAPPGDSGPSDFHGRSLLPELSIAGLLPVPPIGRRHLEIRLFP